MNVFFVRPAKWWAMIGKRHSHLSWLRPEPRPTDLFLFLFFCLFQSPRGVETVPHRHQGGKKEETNVQHSFLNSCNHDYYFWIQSHAKDQSAWTPIMNYTFLHLVKGGGGIYNLKEHLSLREGLGSGSSLLPIKCSFVRPNGGTVCQM